MPGTHQFGNFYCRGQPNFNAGAGRQYNIPDGGNSRRESADSMITNQQVAAGTEGPKPTPAESGAVNCGSPPFRREASP